MLSTTHAQGRPHQAMCVRSAAKGRLDSSRLSQATRERTVRTPSAAVARENSLYVEACRYATGKRYEEARRAFESLLERHPHMCNAWVSYAQVNATPNVCFSSRVLLLMLSTQLNTGVSNMCCIGQCTMTSLKVQECFAVLRWICSGS